MWCHSGSAKCHVLARYRMATFRLALTLATALWPAVALAQAAQAEPAATAISGFVQAAYHVDFMNPNGHREPLAFFVCYTPPGNTFVLHAAHIALTHSFDEHASATVEADAGYDATKTAAYPFNGSVFDIQEAYATYKAGLFSVIAGKFAGYEGSESIEGPTNPTITRGYSFNLAEPNTHTGVKFHLTSGAIDFGIGVVNGWDTLVDNNDMKTIIAKLGLTPDASLMISLNGTFGPETENVNDEQRLSIDLNGEWTLSEHVALRFQANFGMDGIGGGRERVYWYVFGIEPAYHGDVFTFGARAEFFRDPDGARASVGDASFFNLTLTPGWSLGHGFEARVELRGDYATRAIFGQNDDPKQLQISAAVAAEYVF
jgi:hypothetical protein